MMRGAAAVNCCSAAKGTGEAGVHGLHAPVIIPARRHVEHEGVRSGLGVAEGGQQAQAVGQGLGNRLTR